MGKRKEGRKTNINAKAETEIKNAKTVGEESAEVRHEGFPIGVTKCGRLQDKRIKNKVNNEALKGSQFKKRNKIIKDTEIDTKFIEKRRSKTEIFVDDESQKVSNKKSKKRKKVSQEPGQDSKVIDEPKQQEVPSKKIKKRNKPSHGAEQNFKDIDALKQQVVPSKKSKKRDKASEITEKVSNVILEPKGKKIIFVDDELQETTAAIEKIDNTEKKKKFLNDDEADVREEDIDNFCDELDEKDNAQYEEWVKLIEANFHSNKKKPK